MCVRVCVPCKPGKGRASRIFGEEADDERENRGWAEGQGREACCGGDVSDDDELDLGGFSGDERAEAEEVLAVIAGAG